MSYVYKDDTPAEDMTARDHYIKASTYAEKAAGYANTLTGLVSAPEREALNQSFTHFVELAKLHTILAENDINGAVFLTELE